MIEPKTLNELGKRILAALPPGLEQLSEDARKNMGAAMASALAKADLVTREEFDVQSAVLARTRQKLTELERSVAELERILKEGQPRQDG